jgi:hypothetical protein
MSLNAIIDTLAIRNTSWTRPCSYWLPSVVVGYVGTRDRLVGLAEVAVLAAYGVVVATRAAGYGTDVADLALVHVVADAPHRLGRGALKTIVLLLGLILLRMIWLLIVLGRLVYLLHLNLLEIHWHLHLALLIRGLLLMVLLIGWHLLRVIHILLVVLINMR